MVNWAVKTTGPYNEPQTIPGGSGDLPSPVAKKTGRWSYQGSGPDVPNLPYVLQCLGTISRLGEENCGH